MLLLFHPTPLPPAPTQSRKWTARHCNVLSDVVLDTIDSYSYYDKPFGFCFHLFDLDINQLHEGSTRTDTALRDPKCNMLRNP